MKVPRWLVAPLHKAMGLHYNTVRNWAKYGVPKKREEEVKGAMERLENAESSKRQLNPYSPKR